jgi:hypothetical protein
MSDAEQRSKLPDEVSMALQWVLGIERFGKGETGEIMGFSPVVNGFNPWLSTAA